MVNNAGSTLDEIIANSNNVVDNITLVATASEEQTQTAEEISKNLASTTKAIQSSSTATTQIANTAEVLNTHMQSVTNLISNFKIGNTGNNVENQTQPTEYSTGSEVEFVD